MAVETERELISKREYFKVDCPDCLSVCLSVYLSVYLSIYLSVYLSIYLSIYQVKITAT